MIVLGVALSRSLNAASLDVLINDGGFSPATITVNQGDEVFWFNDGTETHSTKAAGGEWNSGRLPPLDFFSTVLVHTGAFPYACTQHPGATGLVNVVAAVIPPTVSVFYPADGTRFGLPARFSFQVLANDSDGSVSNVAFFVDGLEVNTATAPPYSVIVSNLAPGTHQLKARATDNQGYAGESMQFNISVPAPAGGATHQVDIIAGKFTPGMLSVTSGDAVVFRNLDPASHTATGGFTSAEAFFGSLQLTHPMTATNIFTVPGTYAYACGLHPSERGTVVVSQATSPPLLLRSPMLNESGRFTFDFAATPGARYVVESTAGIPPVWNAIVTNTAATHWLRYTDASPAILQNRRFYRVLFLP